ncbi:MAG: ABC transporter substrate-binding protein [Caldilineaceae bacterium]|nr:ABC transporter substrate-binding protein [Caldilineaceae bacterium]
MRLSAIAGVGAVAVACGGSGAAPAAPVEEPAAAVGAQPAVATSAPVAVPTTFNEAPMLAELVASGDLPAVDERLPKNPLVSVGLDGVGNYGGNMRKGFNGQADGGSAAHMLYKGLLDINHEMLTVPLLAESWETNDDATEFTFHLREGLKWSDGTPMTTDDFLFWYNDFQLNSDLTPSPPEWLTSVVDGERVPLEMTAPDDLTIKVTFSSPNSLFYLSGGIVNNIPAMPSHYLKQFHIDYTEDQAGLEAAVGEAGLGSWAELFLAKNDARLNVELPTHAPWIQDNPWTDEYVTMTRNPYYWGVDEAGNQLPYMDTVSFRLFQDPSVLVLWIANGEIDCQSRHVNFTDLTVLKESEARGDYAVQSWRWTAVLGIHFNMTAKNPQLRELFQERDFRIAVSLGVDRERLNDLNYDGFGTPMQYGPPVESPLYSEKLTNAYLEYDPDRANQLLDDLGYSERDAEGFRLFKDGSGERIRWTMLGAAQASDDSLLTLEFLKELGFDVNYRGVDRSLSIEQHQSNDVECTMGFMDRNLVPLADPQIWIKHTNIDDRPWANAWTAWRVDPNHPIAEEPPADHWIWDIWNLWDEIRSNPNEEERNALFMQILDIWAEELPSVGFLGEVPRLVIVKNGLKGVHAGYPWDCCSTIYEYIIDDTTWYWEEPENHTL